MASYAMAFGYLTSRKNRMPRGSSWESSTEPTSRRRLRECSSGSALSKRTMRSIRVASPRCSTGYGPAVVSGGGRLAMRSTATASMLMGTSYKAWQKQCALAQKISGSISEATGAGSFKSHGVMTVRRSTALVQGSPLRDIAGASMAYERQCQSEEACSEPNEYSAADARDDQRRPFGGNPCTRPESRLQRSRALTKSQLYGAKLVLAVEIAKGNCEFLNLLLDLGQAILHLHALIGRAALLLEDLERRTRFVQRRASGAQLQVLIGLVVLNYLDLRRAADGTDGRDEGIEAVGRHADSEM